MSVRSRPLVASARSRRAATILGALGALSVSALAGYGLARAETPESPLDSAERIASSHATSFDVGPLVDRLRAIRAAPFGPTPEDALEPLARIAAGRDPSCVAVAAVALRRITSRLDRGMLDAHEADPAALERAERQLRALVADGSARPDIRRLANLAASELAAARSPGHN